MHKVVQTLSMSTCPAEQILGEVLQAMWIMLMTVYLGLNTTKRVHFKSSTKIKPYRTF